MTLFDTGPTPPGLEKDEQSLIQLYVRAGRTLDDLPYTPEFEGFFAELGRQGTARTRHEVFHKLHNLRKAGKLPRMGRSQEPAPRVTPEDEAVLAALVVERVGSLGQRDQLPYDPRIDDLAQVFCQRTGRTLTQHDVWRLIAKIAK